MDAGGALKGHSECSPSAAQPGPQGLPAFCHRRVRAGSHPEEPETRVSVRAGRGAVKRSGDRRQRGRVRTRDLISVDRR